MPNRKLDLNKLIMLNAKVLSFSINNPNNILVTGKNLESFDFSIDTKNAINLSSLYVKISPKIRIDVILKISHKSNNIFGKFDFDFLFLVEDLNKFIIKKKNKVLMKESLAANLIGISYSTARGIIISKSIGTCIENAILPIIYPHDLLKRER